MSFCYLRALGFLSEMTVGGKMGEKCSHDGQVVGL